MQCIYVFFLQNSLWISRQYNSSICSVAMLLTGFVFEFNSTSEGLKLQSLFSKAPPTPRKEFTWEAEVFFPKRIIVNPFVMVGICHFLILFSLFQIFLNIGIKNLSLYLFVHYYIVNFSTWQRVSMMRTQERSQDLVDESIIALGWWMKGNWGRESGTGVYAFKHFCSKS